MNDYIWLWLKTLEGSGDNRGGLKLFITIETPGWEKQTRAGWKFEEKEHLTVSVKRKQKKKLNNELLP